MFVELKMNNDLLFDPHKVYPIREFWATLAFPRGPASARWLAAIRR